MQLVVHQMEAAVNEYEINNFQIQKANHHYNIGDCASAHLWFRPKILFYKYYLVIRLTKVT